MKAGSTAVVGTCCDVRAPLLSARPARGLGWFPLVRLCHLVHIWLLPGHLFHEHLAGKQVSSQETFQSNL